MCYYTEFRRSWSNRLSVGRAPKNGDAGTPLPWDGGMSDPKNMLLLHRCYRVKFSHSRSNRSSVIMEICQKILTSHLSSSLKVIGTDTYRSATYDFLLVIRSKHRPISYRFRDNCTILQPRVFNALAEGVSLEFCNGARLQKK